MVIIYGVKSLAKDKDFISVIQQATIAAIGVKGKKQFDISGPFPFANGLAMTFTLKEK
jgi:hypothetical protein